MPDKRITIISETNDLSQRILEVNAGLSRWLTSECDYNSEKDMVRLIRSGKQKESYVYQYEILKGEYLYHIPSGRAQADENDKKTREWVLRPIDEGDMTGFAYC